MRKLILKKAWEHTHGGDPQTHRMFLNNAENFTVTVLANPCDTFLHSVNFYGSTRVKFMSRTDSGQTRSTNKKTLQSVNDAIFYLTRFGSDDMGRIICRWSHDYTPVPYKIKIIEDQIHNLN